MQRFRWWLILCCACLAGMVVLAETLTGSETYQTRTTADLNGDGKADTIVFTWKKGQPTYTLQVGAVKQVVRLDAIDEAVSGVRVVDLHTGARGKELVVCTTGGSNTAFQFYAYDGKALHILGRVGQQVEIPGAGFIYVKGWAGFWQRLNKYTLNANTHKLELVPQPFHYVGVSGTVQRSLPIYAAQAKKTVVANLQPKSKVLILLNQGNWYLIKSTTGLVGWMPAGDVTDKNFPDLPWGG
ncbi:MAG: hypothetical protein ACYDCO_18650 [Armatimonadota bacterium]